MTVVDIRQPVGLVAPAPIVVEAPRADVDRSFGLLTASYDALALMVAFTIGSLARVAVAGATEGPTSVGRSLAHEIPYALVYLVAMAAYGLYGRTFRRVRRSWFVDFGQLARSLITGSIATVALSSGLHRLAGLPKLGWVEAAAMSAPALALVPVLRGSGSLMSRRQGRVRSRVAVVGSSPAADRIVRRLQRVADIELAGVVTDAVSSPDVSVRTLGGTIDLIDICERHGLDRIFVISGDQDAGVLDGIIRHLPPKVHVSIVPTFSELLTWQSQIEDLDGMTVMEVPPAQLGLLRRAAKRSLDVALSSAALIAAAPLLAAIGVAVKLTSPGPVLFRQTRIGLGGQPFFITKFRTMTSGADGAKASLLDVNEGDGPMFKIRSDPRVTPFGGFLRRTSLDELPQLLNVLVGQMSLVGPRPLVPEESACFDGWAARRFEVKPGMTGLWQVSGRSDLPFEELRQLDYAYATSWSLWWDLKILWQTPASVLRGRGAY
jgi:exopolysaccharide biosynthesis polyprenyl glycosylphosphotransferase